MMMETVPSGTILHGRYRIERVLGSGGFGHVYLAVDLNTNQQFALKEYFVTGSSGQAQLQHEAQVLSQLHHPNLPTFHTSFTERGHYFVVLTYIDGNDLTELVRVARQRNEIIPIARVIGWVLSICDAVHSLHTQKPSFIHRDIKPDNIRITPNGTAILVDLGNAKVATADGARTLFFIRHQGTPGYAPQEQYPGGTGTDATSDVYALGGTLYFVLTAHEPPSVSTRNESIRQRLPDLPSLQEQLANNPPEESAEAHAARQFRLGVSKPGKAIQRHSRHLAQLGTLPPELLNQLNNIIKKAMAMRQKDRYPSIADFSNELRKVMAALPPSPAPNPPAPRPIDPNSTQPDLPFVLDNLQAKQGNVNPISNQPTRPIPNPAQSSACPRCGTSLVPQASFCPICGTALNSSFKNSAGDATATINKSSSPKPSSAHDSVSDITRVIAPQVKAQAPMQTYTPTMPKPESQPSPPLSPHIRNIASSMTQVQTRPATQAPSTPSASQPPSPAQPSGFNRQTIMLIILIVILVVLIAIMVIFLINYTHNSQALHYMIPWYAFE